MKECREKERKNEVKEKKNVLLKGVKNEKRRKRRKLDECEEK